MINLEQILVLEFKMTNIITELKNSEPSLSKLRTLCEEWWESNADSIALFELSKLYRE